MVIAGIGSAGIAVVWIVVMVGSASGCRISWWVDWALASMRLMGP